MIERSCLQMYGYGQYQSFNPSKCEIVHATGEQGARAYQLPPNSSTILLDDTAPLIWVKTTDGAGYYQVVVSTTLTAAEAGEVTLSMYKDGVAIPGAQASTQATADEVANLSFPWIIRKANCCDATLLTFVASAGATINNIIVEVTKL